MKRWIPALALLGGLLSCGYYQPLVFRGTNLHDDDDDIRVIGDRAHDTIRLGSTWAHFEIPLPYAEDWHIYVSEKGTVSADSTQVRLMVSIFPVGRARQIEDKKKELKETHLAAAQASSPGEIDQIVYRKRNSDTLLEYTYKDRPRWFAVCGIRRLTPDGDSYLIRIKAKERPEPGMSELLERLRDIIARDFKITL